MPIVLSVCPYILGTVCLHTIIGTVCAASLVSTRVLRFSWCVLAGHSFFLCGRLSTCTRSNLFKSMHNNRLSLVRAYCPRSNSTKMQLKGKNATEVRYDANLKITIRNSAAHYRYVHVNTARTVRSSLIPSSPGPHLLRRRRHALAYCSMILAVVAPQEL